MRPRPLQAERQNDGTVLAQTRADRDSSTPDRARSRVRSIKSSRSIKSANSHKVVDFLRQLPSTKRPGVWHSNHDVDIKDPVTSSTAANIMESGPSTVQYYADKGLIRYHRMPSGLRLYEREDCERLARERADRRRKVTP